MTNEGSPLTCLWCRKTINTNEDFFDIQEKLRLGKLIRGMHWNCIYELARHWAHGGFGTDDLRGGKKPHHKYRGLKRGNKH